MIAAITINPAARLEIALLIDYLIGYPLPALKTFWQGS
jgi:hypothetical protein